MRKEYEQFTVSLALLFLTGVSQAAQMDLAVANASYQTLPQERVGEAVIEAVHKSTVSSQISGRVTEINFDVDDVVPKGSVIMRLRDRQQRAALKSAQARHQEAKAEFQRVKNIFARKLVSRALYDKAEADLKAASAALEQAQEQLAHTVIKAPYSGIVTQRYIEVGETASAGKPLMSGLSLEHLRATTQLPQAHVATVRALSRAQVILPDGSRVAGSKLTISPHADPVTHSFQVRVELPEGQHDIYPGMFAKVAFVIGEVQRLLIPAKAVVHRSEVTAVYVVKPDGQVFFRQIRLGRVLGESQVEVLAGLEEGEQLALDPVSAAVALKQQRAEH
ncbi:MAG: efflux RND transporter periplasmic adaptor subunit [Gammaproteobacteria bacterium]|nr:efflux RND transporter periplasmic adaptor subunit [Gammaproteobacteria bacterium]